MRPNMELSIDFVPLDTLPETERKSFFSNLDRTLRRAMNKSITDPYWFDTTRYPNHIDIRVKVNNGVLRFITTRDRVFAPTGFMLPSASHHRASQGSGRLWARTKYWQFQTIRRDRSAAGRSVFS